MNDAEKLSQHLSDWAETDTAVRAIARRVLTEFEVEGDSYGVPSLADVVKSLVKKIESLSTKIINTIEL